MCIHTSFLKLCVHELLYVCTVLLLKKVYASSQPYYFFLKTNNVNKNKRKVKYVVSNSNKHSYQMDVL